MTESDADGRDAKKPDDDSETDEPTEQHAKRKTKNRPGRATRKRKRKLLEIERTAKEAIQRHNQQQSKGDGVLLTLKEEKGNAQTVSVSRLPCDRDSVWPAVLPLRKRYGQWLSDDCYKDDEMALISQLGYLPGNIIGIPCREGDVPALRRPSTQVTKEEAKAEERQRHPTKPVTVELYPLTLRKRNNSSGRRNGRKRGEKEHDGSNTTESDMIVEPFPTIYWLTHPLLRILISKLEVSGLGARIEERLRNNSVEAQEMILAHKLYGQRRHQMLVDGGDLNGIVAQKGWEASALDKSRGVAGMSRDIPYTVKCLHAHAAHYLSRTMVQATVETVVDNGGSHNIVGKWVMEEVDKLVAETY